MSSAGALCLLLALLRPNGAVGSDAHLTAIHEANGTQFAPPLYVGLEAFRHWDKLSYLEIGDRVWGQSTADPAGSNADNSHVMRVLTDGEHVLFDQVGPGVMTWMRMQQNYGGPWKLYLDGTYISAVDPTDLGQITPTTFPARAFPYPLSLNIPQTQGSSIIAASIPFSQSMSWASVNPNGNFYSIYRKLPYGTPLTTWTGSEPITDVVQLLRRAGSDIAPTGIYSQSGIVNLPPGETAIADLSGGPYQMRAIKFRVPYKDKAGFGNSRLRIYWDGETSPSVDAPIKFMAGDGAGVYQPAGRALVQGWAAGAGGDGSSYMDFNIYWPMPFTSTARIAVFSTSKLDINNVNWSVRYEPFNDPPGWWGKFHTTYTAWPNPPAGQDMTFLDATGSGRIVGTVINFNVPGGTLEGDPHFFIDDNNTPQIEVTGTEEWGTGGNYWNGGNQTSLPMGGLPSSVNNPPGEDIDGAALYRYLVADTVPFNRHVVVRWEHGIDDYGTDPYRAAVFWYGNPAQTAILSDDLLIGDEASRTLHNYRSPTGNSYQLTAAYEYPVHNPLSADTGISMTTVSSFTMALNPRNVGAFLRRKFDYGEPNQRANFFIDGQPAGTWYTGGYFNGADIDGRLRRWRDEEFPLPASLTEGKSSVTVRVEFVFTSDPPNTAWTEFRYQMYSFVMPPDSVPNTPTPASTPTAPSTATPSSTATANTTATSVWVPIPSATKLATPQPIPPSTSTPTSTPIPPSTGTPTAIPVPPTSTPCALNFTDVPPTNPFYSYIRCLACRGIISGYSSGCPTGNPCFRPFNDVTRGQAAKIVANSAGYNEAIPDNQQSFEDVPSSGPFWLYVERVYLHGVISGYTCGQGPAGPCVPPQNRPYFLPYNNITRGQLAKVDANAAGYGETPTGQTFEDVSPTNPFYLYIERVASHGVISGYTCGQGPAGPCVPPQNRPYFLPANNVTRGQTSKIVANTFFPGCQTPSKR